MTDTNYIMSIVKILESPTQILFNNTIPVTKFRVQFPQTRNSRIVNLIFWGNLARDVSNYYQTNDYIMIEGYLSLSHKYLSNTLEQNSKKFEITVLKIYPFFLSSNQQIVKN
jgi:single-stranded DNA-binding protein